MPHVYLCTSFFTTPASECVCACIHLQLRMSNMLSANLQPLKELKTKIRCVMNALWMPCRATTHTDLELRARALNIPTKVIHNASIMNAVGACGLQLYRFGEVITLTPLRHFTQPSKLAK